MRELIIGGAVAGGKEAAWVAESMNRVGVGEPWSILGYVDDNADTHGLDLHGYRVLGFPEAVVAERGGAETWFACVIGDNTNREKIATRLLGLGCKAATLIHPSAVVCDRVPIGEGAFIAANVAVSVDAQIGRFVLLNLGSNIGHDVVMADFSQAAPGASINGYCKIGRGAVIGSNATVHPRIDVGDGGIVGAGAWVTRHVPEGATVFSEPARRIK